MYQSFTQIQNFKTRMKVIPKTLEKLLEHKNFMDKYQVQNYVQYVDLHTDEMENRSVDSAKVCKMRNAVVAKFGVKNEEIVDNNLSILNINWLQRVME